MEYEQMQQEAKEKQKDRNYLLAKEMRIRDSAITSTRPLCRMVLSAGPVVDNTSVRRRRRRTAATSITSTIRSSAASSSRGPESMGISASGSASAGAGAGGSSDGNTNGSNRGNSSGMGGGGSGSAGAGAGGSSSSGSKGNSSGMGGSGSGSAGAGAGAGNGSSHGSSPGGSGGNSNANGGGNGVGGGVGNSVGGGMNAAGNRASGAGPGASSNRNTTGSGFGGNTPSNNPGFGGAGSPRGVNSIGSTNNASPTTGMDSPRGMSNSPLNGGSPTGMNSPRGMANPALNGDDKAKQGAFAEQARASEITSMKNLAREQALGTISKAEVGVKDPYNTLSGGVTADVTSMTVSQAIAFAKTQWTGKIANVIGAYQVKDTTLAAVAKELGLLNAKMTPEVQDKIAVGLMQQRANKATVNGAIDVDKFAKELSKEWASLATPTDKSYYDANGIDKASVSYSKVHEIAAGLVANGVVSAGKSVSSITSKDVSSVQTNAPGVSHFNSTYMGGTPATSAPASATPSSPQKSTTSPSQQQNDPSGLPPGTYRGYDPSGLPANTPQTAPAPTNRPAAVNPAAPAPAPAPVRQRSTAEKMAAAAVDVGLGMVPGVGTAVSVVNGGLALTGNPTLGDRVVGSFVTGQGAGSGPDSGASGLGGGNNKQQKVEDTSTVQKKDESFEDRYMKFIDPTVRPTPKQKWDYNAPGYA
jgi:muramidase (phage lysozyme)